MIQRSVFSFAKANPRELIRSNFNTSEIEHRAITYLPDDLLRDVPQSRAPFSLLDGFRASLPDDASWTVKAGRRRSRGSKGTKLLEDEHGHPRLVGLRREKARSDHKLEMMGIRKTMCAGEIKEIDDKIANLNTMRKVILERLADLEEEENDIAAEVVDLAERIEVLAEELEDEEALNPVSTTVGSDGIETPPESNVAAGDSAVGNGGFMSESIYEKLPKVDKETPSPRSKRKRMTRRTTMPVLHEHMEPGSRIREMQAHNDVITALDFDAPFGTMVTAALDDTVRVWDLNAGRCMGILEGHLSSVRCLQVEGNLVATGSMDASIRLWDLNQADYVPPTSTTLSNPEDEESPAAPSYDGDHSETAPAAPSSPNAMADCPLYTLQAHVDEITALNFRGSTLVSGSADKTLRQWDLENGRCVQTLDVLWAAAQAASIHNTEVSSASGHTSSGRSTGGGGGASWWRPTSARMPSAEADFIGALQVFDAALACGTADGMVRLWDLRSGTVHRSLVGHTGPVSALQFDDVFLVTASRDRSIRVSSSHFPFCLLPLPAVPCCSLTRRSRSGTSAPALSTTRLRSRIRFRA